MAKNIIEVKNLSKSFIISHEAPESYTALRDVITQKTKKIFSFARTKSTHSKEEFFALKDFTFNVSEGDRVGIIGRNGAGKSTLLKILSRISEPTKGAITIRGRIASLLEVGTGFHPELSGRENIFLNGAILGMTRNEIRKKFDEIVDFAEVEKFLDTPVKRYSSGMYVRLAFAVAAHLEPEILVVDEVLAVGDAQFQKKCLGKMEDVSKNEGRTVLFVSHNMEAIRALCSTGMLLKNGKLKSYGNAEDVISEYLAFSGENADNTFFNQKPKINDWYISEAWIQQNEIVTNQILNGEPLVVNIKCTGNKKQTASFEVIIRDKDHYPVLFAPLGLANGEEFDLVAGEYQVKLELHIPYLAKGRYYVDLLLAETGKRIIDQHESCLYFDIEATYNEKTSWSFFQERGQGCMLLNGKSSIIEYKAS